MKLRMTDDGLSARQREMIRAVLVPYADKIERVRVFGSRATGRFKPESDIDLVLDGTLDPADLDRLWTLFDNSPLALKVDVQAYHLIAYPALRHHIDQAAKPLFTRDDLKPLPEML